MRATEFIIEGKKNRRDKRHTIKPRGPETHAEPSKANESKDVKQLKVDAEKPRNFVAKNAKMGGAGAHKDKKKAAKQGDVKHKNKQLDMAEAAPKGWEGTVKAMKKHKEIDNPYALTNWMKNKGYKSHKKND